MRREDTVLAVLLRKKLAESGLSLTEFVDQADIKNGKTHLSYLFNGKRGLSFWKAVRICRAVGIKLHEIEAVLDAEDDR